MFRPDDPLAPPRKAFDEPWQAQALALADTMVNAGRFTAAQWAETLGAALNEAEEAGAPDTLETYYNAVVTALERLSRRHLGITQEAISKRRTDWEKAYRRTPHGRPVELRRVEQLNPPDEEAFTEERDEGSAVAVSPAPSRR